MTSTPAHPSVDVSEPAPRAGRRRRPVPVWVTVVAVLLGLFATAIGVLAIVDPSAALGYVAGADDLAATWGGRNLGLGVVLLLAVLLRSARGYVIAFGAQLAREVGDLVAALPDLGGAAFTLVFLLVDVACLVAAVRAVRAASLRTKGEEIRV